MTKTSSEAIIVAARELFRRRGYAGTSMQDIAAMVGIRKASLYSRVADKAALVAGVLDLTFAEIFDFDSPHLDWRQTFLAAIHRMAAHLCDHGQCVAFHLAYGLPDEEAESRAEVVGFFTACRDRLAAILRGGLDAALAEDLAVEAITRIEGATLWLVISGDATPLEQAVAALSAQAEAMALDVPDLAARRHLDALVGGWQRASAGEKALATRLADAEARILFVEQALRGQIEAESCFL